MADRQYIVESVQQRLREVVPDLREETLDADKDLREFAGFDSLGVLEILVWLESEFSLVIPDEELNIDNFSSVGKMADYVVDHR
ncbi:acyl carrier protein [Streptomyces hainanensis]|uniref:Acyl carrier protein n=1 Tax=Streptomyces hainanensis TaxID=402648 RepID=A0A4R4TMX7_9ACTN|nr:acyl carrier protein [Streptomyces hainanensis]TDC79220.1 acyl carrier protein [Streptomyces hainanensis]